MPFEITNALEIKPEYCPGGTVNNGEISILSMGTPSKIAVEMIAWSSSRIIL